MRVPLLSLVPRATALTRHMSNATQLTSVVVNDKTGIATLTMNRPPINALNVELLCDLHQSLQEIEHNRSRGLILTSANANVFSAGLDLNELYKPDKERIRLLWTALQDVWLALYGSNVPTAAAISGHAPAGGCLLSTSCEYRVMLPQLRIGLNEVQLGMMPPLFCMFNYLNVLPRRLAERALNQGRMFTTAEALQIGLVDEVASSKEEALTKCAEFIGTFAQVNPLARSLTKQQSRASDLQQYEKQRSKDSESFFAFIDNQQRQEGLGIYIKSLKKKASN